MSPFLKAIGVGVAVLVVALLIMWGVSRAFKQPFLPELPRAPVASPTPAGPLSPTS